MTEPFQKGRNDGTDQRAGLLSRIHGGVHWRARKYSSLATTWWRNIERLSLQTLGFRSSQSTLIRESQSYWDDPSQTLVKQNSHWRGAGIFVDDARWLSLGHGHLKLYQEFARALEIDHPLKRILEWGCGGGMNAVHFARIAAEFYGVDVSRSSLDECARQMQAEGLLNFRPILIDAADPEGAVGKLGGLCDLFLSTYVYELLPSPEYGLRVLRIAHRVLSTGGIAMIQVKYSDGNWRTQSLRWGYVKNLAWNATYRIEEFWQAAEECGFAPKLVTLLPKQPLVNDRNYAYFLLRKA